MEDRASLLIVDDERGPGRIAAHDLQAVVQRLHGQRRAAGVGDPPLHADRRRHARSAHAEHVGHRGHGTHQAIRPGHRGHRRHRLQLARHRDPRPALRRLRLHLEALRRPADLGSRRPGRRPAALQPAQPADEGRLPRQPVARAAHAAERHHRLQRHPHRRAARRRHRRSAHRPRTHPDQLVRAAQPGRRRPAAQCARRRRDRDQHPARSASTTWSARAVEKFRPLATKRACCCAPSCPAEELSVISDEEKIERILWALLDNAIKFTPGGVVSVAVRQRRTAERAWRSRSATPASACTATKSPRPSKA